MSIQKAGNTHTTYKSVKFVKFPNVLGIVPVKLFEDTTLYNEETVRQAFRNATRRKLSRIH